MTPELQAALIQEAARLKAVAIDPDIFRAIVSDDLDPKDSEAIAKAAKDATEGHPDLFKFEKPWGDLDAKEFREREASFREGLRKSKPLGPNEFASLDAALLDPQELQALTRLLSGRGSSWDRSICQRALANQLQLLGGDAA